MDWLREKVSGKRNRYVESGYNLDITYITDRVLAMSFPASGIEKWYRNDISQVVKFLNKRHPDNYRIYNLSNRTYNYAKFKNKVASYEWEDHHSPPILMLFQIWDDMYKFLQDPNNVAVVHCNAGKGRTGTAIAWFMIYSGLAKNAQEAIRYYGRKRFSTGLGITQPSQIRYVRYFELIFRAKIVSPSMHVLKKFNLHTVPHISGKTCKPYLEIVALSTFTVTYSGKSCDYLRSYR